MGAGLGIPMGAGDGGSEGVGGDGHTGQLEEAGFLKQCILKVSCDNPPACCTSSLYSGRVVFGHLVLFPHICEIYVQILCEKREGGGANFNQKFFLLRL